MFINNCKYNIYEYIYILYIYIFIQCLMKKCIKIRISFCYEVVNNNK